VKTQLSGYLTEVAFQEGQMVKKGDFLAQIDPRPIRWRWANRSQFARIQALLKNAQLDLARYNTLVAAKLDRKTDPRHTGLAGRARPSRHQNRSGADRRAKAEPLPMPISSRRSPAESGCARLMQQLRADGDPNGIVVVTQLQPISVILPAEDNLPAVMNKCMRA
jgi:multidrug efflux system membrane fusion protein